MKKILLVIALLVFIGCSYKHNLKPDISNLPLPARIENIINNTDPNINIGIKIISLDNNKIIYEKNPNRYYIPGSTIKLATLAAALYYLGPSYRFSTSIYTDSFKYKNNLVKNLYIKGSGDPSLMHYDLANLAQEIRQQNIKIISGDIYIDDFVFDDILWPKGAMWDDRKFGFGAPLTGLSLNYNRLVIKTRAAHKENLITSSIINPATSYIKISSQALTKSEKDNNNLKLFIKSPNQAQEKPWSEITSEGLSQGDHIIINGVIAKNSAPVYSLLSIKDPSIFAGYYLKEQLNLLGIKFSGKILRKETPKNALLLASHQSRALAEALIDFTKISNNIAHDSLVKAIAAHSGQRPATSSLGLKLIANFLAKEVGINEGSLLNSDGSGISHYNKLSPDHMISILRYASSHFTSGPEFLASMPLMGLDGNLGSRLKSSKHLVGNIRAKSGTLTGVTSIAGYFIDDNYKKYAFSIMINGFVGNNNKYINLQEEILATSLAKN